MASTDPIPSPENAMHFISQTNSITDSIISLTLPIATKLNHNNYLTWKSQILPILHGYNLAWFLESSSPAPTKTTTEGTIEVNPDFVLWHHQDQLLLGWIRSSLTELIQVQVVSCSTTAEIWSNLLSTFSSSSRAKLTNIRRQLQSITKGSSACTDYLQKIRKIADELAFIGSPISDEDLVLVVLNGLGAEFNSFTVVVTTVSRRDPLSFTDIHGMLLSHEALLTDQGSISNSLPYASAPQALMAKTRSGYKPRYQPSRTFQSGPHTNYKFNHGFFSQNNYRPSIPHTY
jgi:gag-polypeptide of LTR copia-type